MLKDSTSSDQELLPNNSNNHVIWPNHNYRLRGLALKTLTSRDHIKSHITPVGKERRGAPLMCSTKAPRNVLSSLSLLNFLSNRRQTKETSRSDSEKVPRGERRRLHRLGIRERRWQLQGGNHRHWLHNSWNLRVNTKMSVGAGHELTNNFFSFHFFSW